MTRLFNRAIHPNALHVSAMTPAAVQITQADPLGGEGPPAVVILDRADAAATRDALAAFLVETADGLKPWRVIAARDGDMFLDSVEAETLEQAQTKGRELLAAAWQMTAELEQARADGEESDFDSELDGFAVEPEAPAPAWFYRYTETAGAVEAVGHVGPFYSEAGALDHAGRMVDRFPYFVPDEPAELTTPADVGKEG